MKHLHSVHMFSVLAFLGVTSNAHIVLGIPIPIIWGSGEEMTELGELPPEVSRAIAEELGTSVTVAFLYEHAHVFYCDLWTWNGRHVIHSGDQYWEPEPAEWLDMISAEPSAKYGKPILYRFPLLPALLTVIILGLLVRKRFFKTDQEKLEALMNDKRYQGAIEIIFGKSNDEEPDMATTSLDEQKFTDAKNRLIGEGVVAATAESNLRKIANAILDNTNSRIDAYLELGSQLDQKGEWDKSAEVYSELISSLPDTDDRKANARKCLETVNEKRTPDATEH